MVPQSANLFGSSVATAGFRGRGHKGRVIYPVRSGSQLRHLKNRWVKENCLRPYANMRQSQKGDPGTGHPSHPSQCHACGFTAQLKLHFPFWTALSPHVQCRSPGQVFGEFSQSSHSTFFAELNPSTVIKCSINTTINKSEITKFVFSTV